MKETGRLLTNCPHKISIIMSKIFLSISIHEEWRERKNYKDKQFSSLHHKSKEHESTNLSVISKMCPAQ